MTRRTRFGATARLVIGAVLLVGVLFLAVFPTRTFLDQRRSIEANKERLTVFRAENDRLRDRIDRLQTPDAIERIAREQYNLAKPGEEVFVIIPSPLETVREYGSAGETVEVIRRAWGVPQAS